MKNDTRSSACFTAILLGLFAWCAHPLQAGLIGIGPVGLVFSIDPTTGAGTLIGASGVTSTLSLATNSITNILYTVDGVNRLDTIDPNTGLATVGPTITGLGTFTTLNGLAFSSTGALFATAFDAGGAVSLFTLNTTTAAATLIGAMSATLTLDIAFSPLDVLYAWNSSTTNGGLMTVNTSTGAGTFVQSGFSAPAIAALTFDTGGNLLGAGANLYSINTATSATTLIGATGFDPRGMALAPVPEPGSIVLTFAALAGLLAMRRKRRATYKTPD